MGDESFNDGSLTEKLAKVNGSQQSIESVSRWCILHRKKAKQVVETWEKLYKAAQHEQQVAYLYLSNDILQNSRRKGSEFVNEFWKVLPAALKGLYSGGGENGRKVASRLVDIWEERKVFGSRGQNLKNEIVGKSPPINNAKNSNPIKVMKRDATSLRVKLAVGGLPERILTSLQLVHDEAVKEEVALNKYRSAVSNVREIEKDVVHASSQGNMNGSDVVDNIQKQENIIQHCVTKLENSEAVRAALVSQLREALQDQESKLEQIRSELLVARGQIEQAANMRQQLITSTSSTAPTAVSQPIMVDPTFNTSMPMPMTMPMPMPVPPPTYPLTSFASSGEEETKKATAAAVAAKLAASTSSAQMLTSILSSLVAEEAASMSSGLKRPKLEPPMQFSDAKNTSDGANTAYFTSGTTQPLSQLQPPFLPPPPPVAPLPANPMMGMPYGYGVSNLMPPNGGPMGFAMPPQQQQQQQHQQQQQQVGQNQQGQPQQPTSGGYYRPIGVGFYGQSHQPPTPPIHRQ